MTTTLGTAHALDRNGRPSYGNTILDGIDVVGQVERTASGNTYLAIGRTPSTVDLSSWEKIAHVVLTPHERHTLIFALVKQQAYETIRSEDVDVAELVDLVLSEAGINDVASDSHTLADLRADVATRMERENDEGDVMHDDDEVEVTLARADGRTPTEHQRSEVARLWAEPGLTTRAIAARVGLSDYQVCAIIQGKSL